MICSPIVANEKVLILNSEGYFFKASLMQLLFDLFKEAHTFSGTISS